MKKVVFGIWFILFSVCSGNAADTYICPHIGTAYDELKRSDAVFIGQVIESKIVSSSEFEVLLEITYKPEKVWHGVKGKEVVVRLATSKSYMPFRKGKKFLVFANYYDSAKSTLWAGPCTRTKDLKYAQKDLEELEEGQRPLKVLNIQPIVRPKILYESTPSQ